MNARDWIAPSDLRVHDCPAVGPLVEAFGKAEPEYMAVWIVRYLKAGGDTWKPFGLPGLFAWLREQERTAKPGYGPVNPFIDPMRGWAMLHGEGLKLAPQLVRVAPETPEGVEVTDEFVLRCYLASWRLKRPLQRFFSLLELARSGG